MEPLKLTGINETFAFKPKHLDGYYVDEFRQEVFFLCSNYSDDLKTANWDEYAQILKDYFNRLEETTPLLRLKSEQTKNEVTVKVEAINGYIYRPTEDASTFTLYLNGTFLYLYDGCEDRWSNWEEFINQVKALFEEREAIAWIDGEAVYAKDEEE